MRLRWIVNLVLAALLGVMALMIRAQLEREATPQTLAGIDPKDLRLIKITREGEPKVRLERGPDGWRMVEPYAVQADEARVEQLLKVLDAPVYRSFPAVSADLSELGLVQPAAELKLDSLDLIFGGLDPIDERRYVASEGLVHLIDDRFHHLLIGAPIDWVSRYPLPPGPPPAFASLSGVPLATGTLPGLAKLEAERVEPLTGELAGEALLVKYADGSALHFLVSEDRRRWSRIDLKIRYVLSSPPELTEDPTVVDTTPPEPELPTQPGAPTVVEPLPIPLDPDAPPLIKLRPDSADPYGAMQDPDAPVSEADVVGAPPEVRLSPDFGSGPNDDGYPTEPGVGFGAEPYKEAPQGFGMDPFAPDPAYDPNAQDWSPDEP